MNLLYAVRHIPLDLCIKVDCAIQFCNTHYCMNRLENVASEQEKQARRGNQWPTIDVYIRPRTMYNKCSKLCP